MKRTLPLLLALLGVAPWICLANVRSDYFPLNEPVFGNEPPVGRDLRGETVYVVIGQNDSSVEGIYDVSDFSSLEHSVLLPIFARSDENPEDVVQGARIRASFNGVVLSQATVANPPGGTPPLPAEVQVVWARIRIGSAFSARARNSSLNLRVSYVQKHVERKFFYLAQSVPPIPIEKLGHNWSYPLIARAPDRALAFFAGECSWERLGEALVVYLRADQIVAIEAR